MRIINVTPKMDALLLGKQGENKSTKFLFDVSGWLEDYPGCSIGLNYRPAKSNVSYPCILTDENNGKKSWLITSSELVKDGDGQAELVCIQDEVVEKDKRTWKTKVMKSLGGGGTAPDPWENWEDTFIELAERAEDAAEDAEESAEDAEAYAVGTRGGTDVNSDDPAYHKNSKYYSEEAGSSASAAAGSATTAGNKASDSEAYAVGKRGGQDVESGDAAYHNNSKYYSEQAAGSATAAAASAAEAASKADKNNPVFTGYISMGRTGSYGDGSVAEGIDVNAQGDGAQAYGKGTIARGKYSQVFGMYNIPDSYESLPEWQPNTHYYVGDKVKRGIVMPPLPARWWMCICKEENEDSSYTPSNWDEYHDGFMRFAEIVGNGVSDNERSNARRLDWDGNEELAGDLTVNKGTANEISVTELKKEMTKDQLIIEAIVSVFQHVTFTDEAGATAYNTLYSLVYGTQL